jgi:hypothetical protein
VRKEMTSDDGQYIAGWAVSVASREGIEAHIPLTREDGITYLLFGVKGGESK